MEHHRRVEDYGEDSEDNDENIVISGISGVFPSTENLLQFEAHLMNKRNLISRSEHCSSTFSVGKIPNVEKFDAAFFGLKAEYTNTMDPMGRILLEKTYEAIMDSGYNPETLKGKKVGVFVGIYMSETEAAYYTGGSASDDLVITGIARCFLANRISYSFDWHGPSFCVDTACSSSMYALHLARLAIRNQDCESAIVAGCNLCLNNGTTLHLQKLGVVSADGAARVLDEAGNGYCRAETVCSLFLQQKKHARRVYANVVHTKVNCDGYKAQGITFPSFLMQRRLLTEFYQECNVNAGNIEWLELHATGTRAGDREEIKAIEVLCQNRTDALPVGSVRSNCGHAEAASTLCSIAKVIIAMRSGVIPANINYTNPRNDIDALHNGLVRVITENTSWNGGLVGINSFGLGGANGHVLLRSFEKSKINRKLPSASSENKKIPKLITFSGRTSNAVQVILTDLEKNPIDDEYISLLHEIHSEDIVRHLHRGAVILHDSSTEILFKEIVHCSSRNRPIWWLFAGMGCQWAAMGRRLMDIEIFAQSIIECQRVLQSKNIRVDLIGVITETDDSWLDDVLHCFVGISAIQIAFVDVLRALNVTPAGIVGHSAGEIACAYADNCLTKEQTILCAYYRGLSCIETSLPNGAMAAVGLSYDELRKRLPNDVDVACRNNANNCTISGPTDRIKDVVERFQNENIFVRLVESSRIAFHSRYVKQVKPTLLQYLKKLIPNARSRSEKWISTSISEEDRRSADATTCSAEYMANNMENAVMFEDATGHIPENAIVIDASPHSLLRAILKQACTERNIDYIPLGVKHCADSAEYLLKSTAKLFLLGETLRIGNLYPSVKYPVSKETRMIAPLIRWQHDYNWNVAFSSKEEMVPGERRYTFYSKIKEHAYMFDHIIDNRTIVPGTIYLIPIWETVSLMYNKKSQDTSIIFEKLRFQRMLYVHENKNLNILVHIQKGSGNFEIVENNQIVLSGKVSVPDDENVETWWRCLASSPSSGESDKIQNSQNYTGTGMGTMNRDDIYKELRIRGFGYKNLFRQMLSSNYNGTRARVKWNNEWVTFLDTVMQTYILHTDTRLPCVLTAIDRLVINVNEHRNILKENLDYQNEGVPVFTDKNLDVIEAAGVQIKGVKGKIIPRRKMEKEPRLLAYAFTPYDTSYADAYAHCRRRDYDITDKHKDTAAEVEMDRDRLFALYACLLYQNITRNFCNTAVQILEYESARAAVSKTLSTPSYLSMDICEVLNGYPQIQAKATIVSNTSIANSTPDIQTNTRKITGATFVQECASLKVHLLITECTSDMSNNKLINLFDDGFLLIRTTTTTTTTKTIETIRNSIADDEFIVCCEHTFENEKLIMLRRCCHRHPVLNKADDVQVAVAVSTTSPISPYYLKITQTFEWIEQLKKEIHRTEDNREIVLYNDQNYEDDDDDYNAYSGLLGFYNCFMKEMIASKRRIRCFLILDKDAPLFSPHDPCYEKQIRKNLSVNVYKNKTWGCYVHFSTDEISSHRRRTRTPYAFVKVGVAGDLRTLDWYQGNVFASPSSSHCEKLVHVYYSALNFKDVLLATGVLSYDTFMPSRMLQECLVGCEFCGRDEHGNRFMGMYPAGAISTVLLASHAFLWRVPKNWSLEDAVTVPVAYLTAIAAFFVHGNLKRGESVLIHSGAGGVGQAAINIATFYECEIFTTVGTAEKREFIKKTFPHIKDSHIGNSRDTSFEQLIMTQTNGTGVDLVLNSLAEDKLQASVRCLAKGGRFLEIGKLDLIKDNGLGMGVFLRGISFHCVLLDKIHEEKDVIRNAIFEAFERELGCGSIKPISRTVFEADAVESAFRHMSTGKHVGKIVIKIRPEESESQTVPSLMQIEAKPRFNCVHEKVYIICGGLGGMGLELADWLVLRGAKILLLTSRTGVTNGYQAMRIDLWKSYGTTVRIYQGDISVRHHVEQLLQVAENLGPVDAIFNLAAVIDDKMFENQDVSTFEKVSAPKINATLHLDKLSRTMCTGLRYFVVFSTMSSGYGNISQTNYGYANSCSERICERRKALDLPALAIQWGLVGDVGIMTTTDRCMEKTCELVGLEPQPIRSCLNVLDSLLTQTAEPIVSSFITKNEKTIGEQNKRESLPDTIASILGITNLQSISYYTPLPELGMDSISGLEVRQILELRYDLFLSPRELMTLTFADLQVIQKTGKLNRDLLQKTKNDTTNVLASIPKLRNIMLNRINRTTTTTTTPPPVHGNLPDQRLVIELARSTSADYDVTAPATVFCFPAIDGIAASFESLSKNSSLQLHCFQYISVAFTVERDDNLMIKLAEIFATHMIQNNLKTQQFNIIAYSFGVIIALEVIKILQSKKKQIKAVFIDGSVELAKSLRSIYFGGTNESHRIQIKIIVDLLTSFQPKIDRTALEDKLNAFVDWEEKLNHALSEHSKDCGFSDDDDNDYVKFVANYLYRIFQTISEYNLTIDEKLNGQIAIITAKKTLFTLPSDNSLKKYFSTIGKEFQVDENHFTILQNKQVAEIVDDFFREC